MIPHILICCYLKPAFSTEIAPRLTDAQFESSSNGPPKPKPAALLRDGRQETMSAPDRALLQYALFLKTKYGNTGRKGSASKTSPAKKETSQIAPSPLEHRMTLIAISLGAGGVTPVLREALSMGATQALHIEMPNPEVGDLSTGSQTITLHGQSTPTWQRAIMAANSLSTWLKTQTICKQSPPTCSVHLCSERSLDSGSEAFAAGLAYGLDLAFAHRVSRVDLQKNAWRVQCKGERSYTQWVDMPAHLVCGCSLQPTEVSPPASLPQWLRAQHMALPCIHANVQSAALGQVPALHDGLRLPIPRVKRHTPPPTAQHPLQRIQTMLSAQVEQQGETKTGGSAQEKAQTLHQFLVGEGWL